MSENLNNAEKEFLEIFRYYKSITEDSISRKEIAGQVHKYMSPSNYENLENVLKSLETKGFIKIKKDDLIYLTQLGEDYLWRS